MSVTARLALGVAGVLLAAGCATDDAPTLADLGADELAGQNGDALDNRCNTLPAPEGTVSIDCSQGAGVPSVGHHGLDAGTYAVVLLCETSGAVTLGATDPADLFDDVVVDCPEGPDPAVTRAFTLDEPTQVTLATTSETSGASAMFVVREG